jgi:hypothetical protein
MKFLLFLDMYPQVYEVLPGSVQKESVRITELASVVDRRWSVLHSYG